MERMKRLEYKVSFVTPAFLGNAEQKAQWRTPPFKALIRQWWRIVRAQKVDYDHSKLLNEENALFVVASGEGGSSHISRVRLRLKQWDNGNCETIPNSGDVRHPEVKFPIKANLYLGYGPVSPGRRLAIAPDTSNTLHLMLPDKYEQEIRATMQLIAWFGTLGSRSRNGWGSLQITGDGVKGIEALTPAEINAFTRPLFDCLKLDWPHAIGNADGHPLIWKTLPKTSWNDVVKELAEIKIAFRTQFKFNAGGPHATMQKRLVLAYPVTKHNHSRLGNNLRIANQIRFKVAMQDNQFVGVIAHLPCKMPCTIVNELPPQDKNWIDENERDVWLAVHRIFTERAGLTRI